MNPRALLRIVVLVLAAAATWLIRRPAVPGAHPPVSGTPAVVATAPGPAAPAHPEIGFRDRSHLADHFQKHGAEFGRIGIDDYLRAAQLLRDRPAGGQVLESVREDGVVTRFDRATGDFLAFDRDLVIRTFFRPNDGEAYYQRQLRRGHGMP